MFQPVVLRTNASQSKRVSGVGMLVFFVFALAGAAVTVRMNSLIPVLAGTAIGA